MEPATCKRKWNIRKIAIHFIQNTRHDVIGVRCMHVLIPTSLLQRQHVTWISIRRKCAFSFYATISFMHFLTHKMNGNAQQQQKIKEIEKNQLLHRRCRVGKCHDTGYTHFAKRSSTPFTMHRVISNIPGLILFIHRELNYAIWNSVRARVRCEEDAMKDGYN